ncbi:hypothetical protein [Pseudomonas gingeri]|jgi:hypothetical protein|uniref:hypothetical protein n=1 Tax=Pseudomonas gingeri TaxID=117681 RepID=UPI0015A09DA8|nr:hypothetical protein [Pseudomonas gingeri]
MTSPDLLVAAAPNECAKRGLSTWCTNKGVKTVQLRSQCAGNFKRNEYLGDVVQMCAECRKSNNGGFKIIKDAGKA